MKRFSIYLVSLGLVFSGMQFSVAAADCKGKSQSSCTSDSKCTWVKGFERKNKDGKKSDVKAHCRAKGKLGNNAAGKKERE